MPNVCERKIDEVWSNLRPAQTFSTPDSLKGVNFSINHINNDHLTIIPQNIKISKDAFTSTLHYLNDNTHNENKSCEIRSSNDPENAGPLCRIARQANNNVRCINYILPILAEYEIVGIDFKRPNKTWLL